MFSRGTRPFKIGDAQRGRRRSDARAGFTLVEALLAISITAIAGTALLASATSALDVTTSTLEQQAGMALAQILMDEIFSQSYCELGTSPYQSPLGPGSGEFNGNARTGVDDMDDYAGFTQSPPRDRSGVALGRDSGTSSERNPSFCLPSGALSNWRWSVSAYYVSNTDRVTPLTGSSTSDYRCYVVTVQVHDAGSGWRNVAQLKRIAAYVPNPW